MTQMKIPIKITAMPKVKVEQKTAMNAKAAFGKVKDFFENGETLKKLDEKVKCEFDSTKLSGKAKGGKFEAHFQVLKVSEGESNIVVTVDLPLLLSPFKGKVEETIKRKLSQYLS